jgi:chlorite dismutase
VSWSRSACGGGGGNAHTATFSLGLCCAYTGAWDQERAEAEARLRAANEQVQADLAVLEREAARLREAKKQDDGSKARLRQSAKAVEEAKTRAELVKVRTCRRHPRRARC